MLHRPASKPTGRAEFGDFQTPFALARRVCSVLSKWGVVPASVLEPTCGLGSLLFAALEEFPTVRTAVGLDVNPRHLGAARCALDQLPHRGKTRLIEGDFFATDWQTLLAELPDPLLVIGNPPWVTNSQLAVLGSSNAPQKTNLHAHRGLDALTGKSNFDISEWMLIRLLELLDGRQAVLSMLCKTAVARKVLAWAWKNDLQIAESRMDHIDAAASFGASVDACLLSCRFEPGRRTADTSVFDSLGDETPARSIGCRNGRMVADVAAFERWKHLEREDAWCWRSGIKHDCAKVMEFRKEGTKFRNGLGELVELEPDRLFPLLTSSDLANGRCQPRRWLLVTQNSTGDDTETLRNSAPRTWNYLVSHADRLDRRASSIYRKRPRFSIFGIGDYTFAPWKVAISGFYKRLQFTEVGPFDGRPVVLDDTSYFLPCRTAEEASCLVSLLNSETAREFYSASVFWDTKRPITSELLGRLDLRALAKELGGDDELERHWSACRAAERRSPARGRRRTNQHLLFETGQD